MISANNVSLQYGGRVLFKDVNITFTAGNCYGLIGANGAGKSTFLKVLSGEIEPNKGDVSIQPGKRLSVLKQDHFEFDSFDVISTVLYGNKKLYDIMKEKEALYSKPDFSDEDGIKVSELEGEFAELGGWNAESDAEILLNGLGIPNELHYAQMSELTGNQKVKVLLAQALFGNPDILLLDEPTNHLDLKSITWLENFLMDFENTVIVVSHDRHFLNKICTHIADVDYGKITLYVGNYDFWYEYTQMTQRQLKDQNKRTEQKIKELQEFIQRFSANASKSKQATSRKKLLDNLQLDNIKISSRRYPFVNFKQDREVGNDLLEVKGISKTIGERKVLNNISFMINPNEKVAFVGADELARTTLFKILMGEMEPDEGSFKWGITTSRAYFPKDNSKYFENVDDSLIDWLRPYAKEGEQYDADIRGWLGRMLFSGEEAMKSAKVLSGGERVRCMLCKMMISGANVLILDEPTNHLDLESITALNNGLMDYKGTLFFDSHDHQFVQTIADRIIEILPKGIIDRQETYDEYLEDTIVDEMREKLS
ncbi:MAG: ATP-binding cassette domain-containing protein [Clostridia bacterium]|jgi:ATPase subunit of ABC transporter with duplicated ATPase domains|nr:ATP-binding cassette domain-containing protein [Clostridia bacterium]MCI1999041.1 ATP-binding cassette domain-containing protein [Clostridia bacterium]MCI2013791.1 ATP-binding cassette domain-containing protein [Clostridia bacterium]